MRGGPRVSNIPPTLNALPPGVRPLGTTPSREGGVSGGAGGSGTHRKPLYRSEECQAGRFANTWARVANTCAQGMASVPWVRARWQQRRRLRAKRRRPFRSVRAMRSGRIVAPESERRAADASMCACLQKQLVEYMRAHAVSASARGALRENNGAKSKSHSRLSAASARKATGPLCQQECARSAGGPGNHMAGKKCLRDTRPPMR